MKASLAPFTVAIAAALLTHSVRADHMIVLTENSSTDLVATYDGIPVTVTPGGPDAWSVTFPSNVLFFTNMLQWIEPENSSLGNAITTFVESATMDVLSDTSSTFTSNPDGQAVNGVGFDSRDEGSISVTFFDNGDAPAPAGVPDSGSTFGLLSLALTALFGANRLRSFRPA